LCVAPFAHSQEPAAGAIKPPTVETYVLPASVPDPLEPWNRVMWGFNKSLMTGVISRPAKFIGSSS
jgi:ABC-type transporter lipoprotein component MlaA